jgi:hypothetical protein
MSITEFLERYEEIFGEAQPERLEWWDVETGTWVPADER